MSKSRLSADPSVGVADLQTAFKEWLDKEDNRDCGQASQSSLPNDLEVSTNSRVAWGTGPWRGCLGSFSPFPPMGVLGKQESESSPLEAANFWWGGSTSQKSMTVTLWMKMDEQLRIAAAMYREIKKDATKLLQVHQEGFSGGEREAGLSLGHPPVV